MKKVLIISYYWPPAGGSGVQRWLKFSKYLPENNFIPVIFTPENPYFEVLDQELVQKIVRIMIETETTGISELDPTEREVYELLVGGFEDSEIARTLRLSADDIRAISSSATAKLGINDPSGLDSRTQAVQHFINRFTEVVYESDEI